MHVFFQSSSQVKCQGLKLQNLKNLQTGSWKCDQFTSPMAAWWPRTRFGLAVRGRPTASLSWFPSCWKVPSPVSARLCKATAAWGWEIRWPRPGSISVSLGRCNFHLDQTRVISFQGIYLRKGSRTDYHSLYRAAYNAQKFSFPCQFRCQRLSFNIDSLQVLLAAGPWLAWDTFQGRKGLKGSPLQRKTI